MPTPTPTLTPAITLTQDSISPTKEIIKTEVTPTITPIEVESSGNKSLFILLAVLAISAVIGYFFSKKVRSKNLKNLNKPPSDPNEKFKK